MPQGCVLQTDYISVANHCAIVNYCTVLWAVLASRSTWSGFDLDLSSERLCILWLSWYYLFVHIFFWLPPFLYHLVSWAWWDWPSTWLTNHRPSVL